jgi:release factor glutamine methyltransferase
VTLAQALQAAAQQGLARLDAQLLLLHTLGKGGDARAWLLAHDHEQLTPEAQTGFAALCQRRLAGEPVAYLTGQRAFYGLTLQVDARVLDPRPDTETLVEWALAVLEGMPPDTRPTVLDLGTGSGAIALAIAHHHRAARVWAVDASTEALAVAAHNAARLGIALPCLHNHWLRHWDALQARQALPPRFDLIVSNPPYIRADDPHLSALRHEPLPALVSGPEGLDDLHEIVANAPAHLNAGGWLLLEHGWDQAGAVAQALQQAGFVAVAHRQDLGGRWRCTGGQWPATA